MIKIAALLALSCFTLVAFAHDISADNALFVKSLVGPAPWPFMYLGAKHMFTGYDHLLFLAAVLFFLYRPRDILVYISLFTLGHSITLLLGVLANWQLSGQLVDAIIGLSIVYKAFENMNGFALLGRLKPNTRLAVMVFGLFHGLGLATKLQDYMVSSEGRLINLLSFNIGVELGQLLALAVIFSVLLLWRRQTDFARHAFAVNSVLLCAGLVLFGHQFTGYLLA
jgi:hypothetical protein